MKNIISVWGKIFFITLLSCKNENIPAFFGLVDGSEVEIAPLAEAVHIVRGRRLIDSTPAHRYYDSRWWEMIWTKKMSPIICWRISKIPYLRIIMVIFGHKRWDSVVEKSGSPADFLTSSLFLRRARSHSRWRSRVAKLLYISSKFFFPVEIEFTAFRLIHLLSELSTSDTT